MPKRTEVNRQVEEWLAEGIVRPSLSDYASPIVLVSTEKDGNTSICCDYRKLNRLIVIVCSTLQYLLLLMTVALFSVPHYWEDYFGRGEKMSDIHFGNSFQDSDGLLCILKDNIKSQSYHKSSEVGIGLGRVRLRDRAPQWEALYGYSYR